MSEQVGTKSAPRPNYQDFDGTGSSKSHEKLKALRLQRLPGAKERSAPLAGLSVLDLGCNEGFFCLEAVKQGAKRVVGIDMSEPRIASARTRCPDATFIHGSWWDLPAEKFDVILFMSAIHYEKEQKRFLTKLLEHLSPDGTLVLECGVIGGSSSRGWRTAKRADGVWRYPTVDFLTQDLLGGYATRMVGRSIDQRGDPVPRSVFHCNPKQSTALVICGKTRSGKSMLTSMLLSRGTPGITFDALFFRLLGDEYYSWRPVAKFVKSMVGDRPRNNPPDWGAIGEAIVEREGLLHELCDLIVAEAPLEVELLYIEGEILRHKIALEALESRLRERRVRPWIVEPMARLEVGLNDK